MNCPPDLATILLDILGLGLLQARAAGWSGDAARAAVEADHVHNLPGLLADYSPARLRYYWDTERAAYLARTPPARAASFQAFWEQLRSHAEGLVLAAG